MSDSSKKHGSSPGIEFKAELKALRQAWKRGKTVGPEAEARLVKGFVSETAVKWISFVDFETRKKAGDSDVSQEQKDRFIAVAAGAAMKPRAERIRELAAAYFSPADYLFPISHFPQKLPIPFKEIRSELSIKETLKLFSHALPEHNPNKDYIDDSVSLAEFILAQTKAPPSAKFVAGFGAPKRITKFLHAAGAETKTVFWASNYLLQSVSQIEKQEKKAEAIANILFISEKNVGKLASPDCVHTPMYEAVLSTFSGLMAQGNTPLPVITIQAKIRNLAKKEPKESSVHELGLKFRERVYSLSPPWKDELRKEEHEPEAPEKADVPATTLLMVTPPDEKDPLEELESLPETEELLAVTKTGSEQEKETAEDLFEEDDFGFGLEDDPEAEETGEETADVYNIPGFSGGLTREKIEALEWRQVGKLPPEAQEPEGEEQPEPIQETEEEFLQEPKAKEPTGTELPKAQEQLPEPEEPDQLPAKMPEEPAEEEPKEAEEYAIFAKYDEAEPLLNKLISAESGEEAREAYAHLSNLFSPEPEDLLFEDMVLEFADLAINSSEGEPAQKGANALFSLSFAFPELSISSSQMLLANIMQVPSIVSNPIIADKLLEGSESEIDLVLALLAVRAKEGENAIDPLDRICPTHALAAEEIATTFSTKVAADILFSISNEAIEPKYLAPALKTLYSANPIHIQNLALDVLLGSRLQQENSLFASGEEHTVLEALLAQEFLFILGEKSKTREATIASGLSKLNGQKAAGVAIQRMEDSVVQDDIAAWAGVLTTLEGEAVDELLMDNFSELTQATQFTATSILAAREPFLQKAEFLLTLSHESSKVAAEAGTALAEMDFSSFDKMEEFDLLYGMRHHSNKAVEAAAGERLQQFLSENNKLLSPAQTVPLSNLARSDEDSAVKEYAKAALLGSAAEVLRTEYSLVTRNFVGALEDATKISVLATYALAKEMQKPFSDDLASQIGKALVKFEEHTDDLSHLRMLYAAKVSGNQDYIEQIIVPSLASRDSISREASNHLYELGSKGITIAARAAKRENIPLVRSQEMQKRISDKAIDVLCRANAFNEVVPMLGHENKATRFNISNFLEQSPDTEEKTSALLAGLKSKDVQVRFASLDLLPNPGQHIENILLLIEDSSPKVSELAAEFVAASLKSSQTSALSTFFLDERRSFFTRQKVADILLENSETVLCALASELQESKEFPRALMFFQSVDALDYFFTCGKTTDEPELKILEGALGYFCQSLAGNILAAPNPTQERLLLLLHMCTIFNQEKVHETARAAAEGKDAGLMLKAACESDDVEVLFAVSELFISLGDEKRAVQATIAFRKLSNTELHAKLEEPYQEVLFGKDHSKISSIISPLEDPTVDLLPYRLVKQVAFEEFVRGQGTSASSDLFFSFGDQFEDIESLFDYGLDAVSELIWAGNAQGTDAAAMAKTLPAHVEDSLQGETELLAKILVLGKHEYLAEAEGTSAMDYIIEHAHRRLEQVTQNSDLSESDAKNKLTLLAELLERKMIEEESLTPSVTNLALLTTVRQELKGSFQNLAAQFRESRSRLLSPEEGITPAQARADARGIKAKRPRPEPPKKRSGSKPGKIPRGGGDAQ